MSDEVWVFAEHQDGKARKVTLELLGAGRELADRLNVKFGGLVLGSGTDTLAEQVASYADKVHQYDDPALEQYNSDFYLQVISEMVADETPKILLAGATFLAKDLFPRVAARLNTGIAMDCLSLDVGNDGRLVARRPLFGGKVLADVISQAEKPQIVLVRPNTFPVPTQGGTTKGEVLRQQVQVDTSRVKLEVLEVVRAARERLDLTEAEIIVTGGRGIQRPENFALLEDLAEVLNATVGTTRAVVDSGWRPHSDQVGKSGKTVSPRLYFAIGVSGAVQHVMGMDTSNVVVAINKDPRAPMFQYADYGIVADAFAILPVLTEELKKELGRG